jgi:hypothetical protein
MVGVGALYLFGHAALLVAPVAARRALTAFPRHAWSGRVLAAVAMAWSVWLVREMPLGFVDPYKAWLYGVGPVVYLLVILLMDELLAARALGGLLLLVAEPALTATRVPGLAEWRLVLVAVAYSWVIAGMTLVLGPFWFRKTVETLCRTDTRCRWVGSLGLALALLMIALGVTVLAG